MDTQFAKFYSAHEGLYRLAEQRFQSVLGSLNFGWYPRFYGVSPNLNYPVLLGLNNGGANYGPRLVHADGGIELFSIMGCCTHDDSGNPIYPPDRGYSPTILHEFNHSFVNPIVANHWQEVGGVDRLYEKSSKAMTGLAHADATTMQ